MSKVLGVFDYFPLLNKIPIDEIAKRLPSGTNVKLIENYIANRILYPQAIPTHPDELKIDLKLLTVALSFHPEKFYDSNSKKIYIPQDFTFYLGSLREVAQAFLDAFKLSEITTIYMVGFVRKVLGTYIQPTKHESSGQLTIWISQPPWLNQQKYQLKLGALDQFPASSEKVDIKFESSVVTLLGKNTIELEVYGGNLGLIVDLR